MKNQDHALRCCAECASHHTSLAKAHRAMSEESTGAAKEFHESCMKEHTSHGEFFVKMYKAIEGDESAIDTKDDGRGADELKAAAFGIPGARDFSKVRADGVHGALPDAPRLVPRPGQPLIEKTTVDRDTETIDSILTK